MMLFMLYVVIYVVILDVVILADQNGRLQMFECFSTHSQLCEAKQE